VQRSLRLIVILAAVCLPLIAAVPAEARLPRSFVGITSEDAFSGSARYREANLSAQRSLRVGFIRQPFIWSTIETSPGRYSFRAYDDFVLAAARHRIAILPVLYNAPSFWAKRRGSCHCPGNWTWRPDNAAFGRFAAALARRYGHRGSLWRENPSVRPLPLRFYQFWNEPSLKPYWLPRPSARQYVALLKAGRKALRKVDRRAHVVTAGLPPSKLSFAVRLMRYLKSMYRVRGAKKHFDTLAINSYAKSTGELSRLLKSVRKLMRKRHDRAKIWVTEIGWATSGVRHRFNVGPRKQARLIRSSIRLLKRSRRKLGLRGFVYFSWRDAAPYPPLYQDLWGLHTGLLSRSGAPKPGYAAFRSSVR